MTGFSSPGDNDGGTTEVISELTRLVRDQFLRAHLRFFGARTGAQDRIRRSPAISWELNLKAAVGTTDFTDFTDKAMALTRIRPPALT